MEKCLLQTISGFGLASRWRGRRLLGMAVIAALAIPTTCLAEAAPDSRNQPVLLCAYALSARGAGEDDKKPEPAHTRTTTLADTAQQAAVNAREAANAATAAKTVETAASAAANAASAAELAVSAAKLATAKQQYDPKSLPADCASTGARGHLPGPGDLVVVVKKDSWDPVEVLKQSAEAYPRLFINGIPAGDSKAFVGAESSPTDNVVRLRFHLGTDDSTSLLWTSIYRANHLVSPMPARVSLSWGGPTATTDRAESGPTISVAELWQAGAGFALMLSAMLFMLWCLLRTDLFRDAASEEWWVRAARYRREWLHLQKKPNSKNSQTPFDTRFANFLKNCGIPNTYPSTTPNEYQDAAAAALLSRQPMAGDENKIGAATIGLILSENNWKPIRQTYSLSRIQAGLWLLFIIGGSIFLCIVTKRLPDLDTTLVALLGLSAATTAVSIAIDSNQGNRPFTPSQGFLSDITTGWDGNHQLHRSQALIINILLLCVGVMHIYQDLSLPVFTASWLSLLGISGLAQTLGKQGLETEKPPASTPSTPATSAASSTPAPAPTPTAPVTMTASPTVD